MEEANIVVDRLRWPLVLEEECREKHVEQGHGREEDVPMAPPNRLVVEKRSEMGRFLGACVANHRLLAWLQLLQPELRESESLEVCILDHSREWNLCLHAYCSSCHALLQHLVPCFLLCCFCACAYFHWHHRHPIRMSSFRRTKPQAMCCSQSDRTWDSR